jgi:hypothetical protein
MRIFWRDWTGRHCQASKFLMSKAKGKSSRERFFFLFRVCCRLTSLFPLLWIEPSSWK